MAISFTVTEKDCILDALRVYASQLNESGNSSRAEFVEGLYCSLLKQF